MFGNIKDFFFLNLKEYSNINIDFPIGIFFIVLSLAICISCFIINYNKMYTVSILKQMIRRECIDEENAKTLAELNIKNSFFIRFLLKKEYGQLSKIIKEQGKAELTYEEYLALTKKKGYKKEKINFDTAKFYISKEEADKAKLIVDTDSSSHLKPILVSVMVLALLICFAILIPELLNLINDSLGQ